MLPFLKNKQEGSTQEPVSLVRAEDEPTEPFNWLEVAMGELFNATTDKERAMAFRAAFEILESEQHTEGPHE